MEVTGGAECTKCCRLAELRKGLKKRKKGRKKGRRGGADYTVTCWEKKKAATKRR
jgi:hypothetical protein